jgi:hypothetical protein
MIHWILERDDSGTSFTKMKVYAKFSEQKLQDDFGIKIYLNVPFDLQYFPLENENLRKKIVGEHVETTSFATRWTGDLSETRLDMFFTLVIIV